ncbi:MAG: serine hydrolase [Bacteroidetes bacterium]|nr:serine hydrolase [Bacteroidota bacterium]
MKRSIIVFFAVIFLALNCSSPKEIQTPVQTNTHQVTASASVVVSNKEPAQKEKQDWVESILNGMTIREKAAQLFFMWTLSPYLPEDSENWQKIMHYVKDVGVGGYYLSIGEPYAFPVNANKMQAAAKIPLLMTADFEWGAGMRIDRATTFPRQMALGATRDTNLAYQMAKAVAEEARALGVHQTYSPDADVNNNPKNPVINTRSFGEDPKLVADFSRAFIRGTQEAGLIATAKHFPGHGDTDIDTHLELPSVNFTRARFDSVELVPFKSSIDAGVLCIMTTHIHASAFDGTDSIPATVSKNIITGLLKNELGFKGAVVTDAMSMKGLTKLYNPGVAAVKAVQAGCDMLLMSPNAEEGIDSLVSAVQRNEISEARLDSSVRKILTLKKWSGLDTNRFVDVNLLNKTIANQAHKDLAKEIARKSITVLGNESGILPFQNLNGKKVLDIVFSDTENPFSNLDLHNLLNKRKWMSAVVIDPRSNKMEYDDVVKKAKSADMILCQFNYQMRSSQMTGFLSKEVLAVLKEIAKLKKPMVGVSIGNPYVVIEAPTFDAFVQTYSASVPSQEACAEVMFGEQPARGKLPITIPGKYKFGEGVSYPALYVYDTTPEDAGFNSDSLKKIDVLITKAVADSAFPGAVVLAAKDGKIFYQKAFGKFTYDSNATPVTTDAMFDLASVTKVIATTSAVMRLYDEKKLSLDDKVIKYFPAFGQNGKENITLYNLLVHNSGLPAWRKFYEFCDNPKCVMDSIFATPLEYKTGDSTVYSDLGLITTGKIIEKITGTTLDNYVDSVFFKPMGMSNTMYNPPKSLWYRVVPTEIDSFWKKTNVAVHGRVHDENAATLGGVSGHAGLFSTAGDLVKLLQMELNGGVYGGKRYLKEETIKKFTARQSEKSSRGIGWDTKSSDFSFSGKYSSMKTFLHTGFTGTSVAADPEKNIIVILLTNRVYPTRANLKISRVRPLLHNAIYESLTK